MAVAPEAVTSDGIIISNSFEGAPNHRLAAQIDGVAAALRFAENGETCRLDPHGRIELEIRGRDYSIYTKLHWGDMRNRPRHAVAVGLARRALDIARMRAARRHAGVIAQPWDCVTSLDAAKAILVSGGTFAQVLASMQATHQGKGDERYGSWTIEDDTIFFSYLHPSTRDPSFWEDNDRDTVDHEIQIDSFRLSRDAVLDGRPWRQGLTIMRKMDEAAIAAIGGGEGLHAFLGRPFLAVYPIALHKLTQGIRSSRYDVFTSERGTGVRMGRIPEHILDEADRLMTAIAASSGLDGAVYAVRHPKELLEEDVLDMLRADADAPPEPRAGSLAERLREAFETAPSGSDPWEAVADAARKVQTPAAPPVPTPPRGRNGMFLEHLKISAQSRKTLLKTGLRTVGDVKMQTKGQLARIQGLGAKGIKEIQDAIADLAA